MQERAKDTRSRILKAGRKLFAQKGFHGTRVDTIAAVAGTNKERIYANFESKKGLFETVLHEAFAEILTAEEQFLALIEDDIPHLAERLLRHYLEFHQKHPYFWRLLSWENLEGGKHVESLKGIKEPAFQHLRRLYQSGQKSGIYKQGVSFETFIYMITSASFFYFSNKSTMTQTLQQDLDSSAVREKFIVEIVKNFNA